MFTIEEFMDWCMDTSVTEVEIWDCDKDDVSYKGYYNDIPSFYKFLTFESWNTIHNGICFNICDLLDNYNIEVINEDGEIIFNGLTYDFLKINDDDCYDLCMAIKKLEDVNDKIIAYGNFSEKFIIKRLN